MTVFQELNAAVLNLVLFVILKKYAILMEALLFFINLKSHVISVGDENHKILIHMVTRDSV